MGSDAFSKSPDVFSFRFRRRRFMIGAMPEHSEPCHARSPKKIGRLLVLVGLGVLLFVGFGLYGIENFRGRAALEEAYALATADPWPEGFRDEGEIPDEENVYEAPILACLNDFHLDVPTNAWVFHDSEGLERLREVSLPNGDLLRYGYFPKPIPAGEPESALSETPADLVVWAALLRSAEGFDIPDRAASPSRQILAAIEGRFGEELAELAEAAKRPRSLVRSVLVEDGPFAGEWASPQSWELQSLFQLLSLRMAAAINAGEAEVFHESFTIHLRLVEGILARRRVSSELSVLKWVPQLVRAVEFGLRRGQWTAEELLTLQGQLAMLPLRESIEASCRAGIELAKRRFEAIRGRRELAESLFWGNGDPAMRLLVARVAPGGWIDLNAAESIRWIHSYGVIPWRQLDFTSWTGPGTSLPDFRKPETFLLSDSLYPQAGISRRLAEVYLDWEMAQIACALEAHRLVHGAYPDSLGSLDLEIPRDPFAKDPLRYFTDGAGYRLYSVGWNRRDDLGTVERGTRGRLDRISGDWVWGESDLPGERTVVDRQKALLHIRLEEERGGAIGDAEFARIWSGQTAEKTDPTAEEHRRARLIERMRARMRKDAETSGR